ncbi:MAG: hypothetical protein HY057_04395 [Rhodospirillales bacterium]|nr:hypothetical protein [Rhodospirillales bacterium]
MHKEEAIAAAPGQIGVARRAWQRLRQFWQEPPVDSAETLRDLLSAHGSYIAQKCAIDYCRVKAGAFSHSLFKEQPFIDALTVCRWESFAATVADLIIVMEGHLRPHVAGVDSRVRLSERLTAMYPEILHAYPLPDHRPEGWDDAIAAFAARMSAVRMAPPLPPPEVALSSARRLFDTLPIHTNMRKADQEAVFGSVKFQMVGFCHSLHARVRVEPVLRDLLGSPADPPAEPPPPS